MYDLYHKSMDFFLIQIISPYSRVSKHAGGSSHSWPKLTWFEPGSVTVRNRSRRLIGQSLSMMSMAFMWNVHVRGFPFRCHHFFSTVCRLRGLSFFRVSTNAFAMSDRRSPPPLLITSPALGYTIQSGKSLFWTPSNHRGHDNSRIRT